MKPAARILVRTVPRLRHVAAARPVRPLHSTVANAANVAPVLGTGPPPEAPSGPVSGAYQRAERRRRQAELLKAAKEIRSASDRKSSGSSPLKSRFWSDVVVREVDGALEVHLDSRPLRHPHTKEIIRLPPSKANLASALGLEWDILTSAQEATKQHLIPLTSLVCRALDIEANDNAGNTEIRDAIVTTLLRYLDTDSLLCWAPPPGPHDLKNDAGESLRDVQKRAAEETVAYLATNVWPGVEIKPVLDGHSILPQAQPEGLREVVEGWISGLDAWEITGLERAVLAGKSLIAAARLVAEWSEGSVNSGPAKTPGPSFGAEEAAKATSLEVDWQTGQWGEVEDTHDVNKEDVRRQLASVVLLVSGTGKA